MKVETARLHAQLRRKDFTDPALVRARCVLAMTRCGLSPEDGWQPILPKRWNRERADAMGYVITARRDIAV